MASISKDEVVHLAHLSNITLTDDEVESMQGDLENILTYVSTLSELDTNGVEPTYQVNGLENVNRPDEVINYGVTRGELLATAPEQKDDQIKVPKVI
ncbi:MAG: Asp-tRNA(Asn)/Glu-tRNA(Gln) amidotransferase subunit GatC [Candidatus Saccharibacteria bacterium]|nr:Asp-tRNA(Asn)/Glu-tRNA(Gln) amidotransferase subunit GatC [Candidatus Saccharibacteria bacterium]